MGKGDKVIFRSNTPRILWGVDINYLLGNICTIKSTMKLISETSERKAYELKEASNYWFPAEEFIQKIPLRSSSLPQHPEERRCHLLYKSVLWVMA